ncbi:hypothetical protein CSW21_03595 [Thermus scotoductus]|uniref:HTH cro/C1-type domain-containing protein n=2 Tax=Thermus scotoductus TaxID=37636 RepID=A0A430R2B3_THESC|nr:hypothetical protein CSW49_03515 [Thermus scotoductus]RTH01463.1 hypothetical protein CSW45_10160 [Thermus scotoductus]RTH17928.1 hypothetical protein CSW42_09705 [Thermus scotoductus]RTH96673.1 hypothetical protein CSW28_12465 [Thermus scotoductus]RTI23889.1 hypothetical protein CSW21_03595 [Thermus scotoductus]
MSLTQDQNSLDPKLVASMSPAELGNFLRGLRIKKGLRQHEVAARAHVHPAYLSRLESGMRVLRSTRRDTATAILKAYGLDEEFILEIYKLWGSLDGGQLREAGSSFEATSKPFLPLHLPVVEAGAGSPAWDDARETLLFYLPELRGKEGRVFGVRIVGDSMEPLLYEGDIAVVWTEGSYGPGVIVAIGIPGNGIVVKQLYYGSQGEMLMHSLNPKYRDEVPPEGSKVWGPVIQIIRALPGGRPGWHLLH